jgi:hypothetical protein
MAPASLTWRTANEQIPILDAPRKFAAFGLSRPFALALDTVS